LPPIIDAVDDRPSEATMIIHVVHPDGGRSKMEMTSLRELDDFLGQQIRRGGWADMHLLGEDMLVVLGPAPEADPS
jgi:hypothetical protein